MEGKAGQWIEPYLTQLDNEDPAYLLNSWTLLKAQLYTLFGDPNEVRKAEQDLDALRMKDGGHVSSYISDFRSLTAKISGWGDRALMHHFRKGLPSRILDQLAVHMTPVDTLQDLMKAALDYDIRYHERSKEKNQGHSNPKTSGSQPKSSNLDSAGGSSKKFKVTRGKNLKNQTPLSHSKSGTTSTKTEQSRMGKSKGGWQRGYAFIVQGSKS